MALLIERLTTSLLLQILAQLRAEDASDGLGGGRVPKHSAGVNAAWRPVGPCHMCRYLEYRPAQGDAVDSAAEPRAAAAAELGRIAGHSAGGAVCASGAAAAAPAPGTASASDAAAAAASGAPAATASGAASASAADGVGARLAAVDALLRSAAFAKWLRRVTDLGVRALRRRVRRFRPGLDYTVATAGLSAAAAPRLEATLCFVDDAGEAAAAAWASDDVGGFQSYILGDDEANTAAETYRCALPCLSLSVLSELYSAV